MVFYSQLKRIDRIQRKKPTSLYYRTSCSDQRRTPERSLIILLLFCRLATSYRRVLFTKSLQGQKEALFNVDGTRVPTG
jgi:hypothetical protein